MLDVREGRLGTSASAREPSNVTSCRREYINPIKWMGKKAKDAARTDKGIAQVAQHRSQRWKMEGPMLHSKLLYCTILRNKMCDNDGRRSKGQRGEEIRPEVPLMAVSVSTSRSV